MKRHNKRNASTPVPAPEAKQQFVQELKTEQLDQVGGGWGWGGWDDWGGGSSWGGDYGGYSQASNSSWGGFACDMDGFA